MGLGRKTTGKGQEEKKTLSSGAGLSVLQEWPLWAEPVDSGWVGGLFTVLAC